MGKVGSASKVGMPWQFSTSERDRRYAAVRAGMARAGLDCLVAPPGELWEAQANSRYLTQIGGLMGAAWAVMPPEGDVTAVVRTERERAMWARLLAWPGDLRCGPGPELVAERLRELGVEGGRVGIVGLSGLFGRPDGIIPYPAWDRLTTLVPAVRWQEANEVLDRSRVVKGPEEIAVVSSIAEANEAAIARMVEVAKPGITQAELWVELSDVLTRATADWPARLSFGSNGAPANADNSLALPDVLEAGGVLSQEIDARLLGYRAQCNHSVIVGPAQSAYQTAMRAAAEVFSELVDWIRPGVPVGAVIDQYVRRSEAKGATARRGVLIHTCGLGADRPRTGIGQTEMDWVLEPGWTFTIKCTLAREDSGLAVGVGEPVTVTESGARRLGRRELVPLSTT